MTDEQIKQALAVCEKRTPGKWPSPHFFITGDSVQTAMNDDYLIATTDPGTGYEAALRELQEARAVCLESNAVCLCGCPMDAHENYGEDGYSCENEKHECVSGSHAALAVVTDLRAQRDTEHNRAEMFALRNCNEARDLLRAMGGDPARSLVDNARRLRAQLREAVNAIPSNWLDPALSGPTAVIGRPPYSCDDVERLLNAVRKRHADLLTEEKP